MGNVTQDIVGKLWSLCNILHGDGVTYHQYVTELTYLLFLKMAKETGTEDQLPKGCRWDDLERMTAPKRLEFYKVMLIHLGGHGSMGEEIDASGEYCRGAALARVVGEANWNRLAKAVRVGAGMQQRNRNNSLTIS